MEKAILMGPFIGEFYWEAGRFAPMLPYMIKKEFKNQDIKYIILTREERFDLYGNHADILVPLRIPGDYKKLRPNCFKLNGMTSTEFQDIVSKFKNKYSTKFKIIKHTYPIVSRPKFLNKNQFPRSKMVFEYSPRVENYNLVESYLPNDKPIVVLAPRFRKGFKRNWNRWGDFYEILSKHKLMDQYNFVICGKVGEYAPDEKKRFYDINDIKIGEKSSLVGILLVILERAFFTFGSQSAIPNLSLLYGVEVFEFGCQKAYHTRTYNIKNTPITFITNPKYNLDPRVAIKNLRKLLDKKKEKNE